MKGHQVEVDDIGQGAEFLEQASELRRTSVDRNEEGDGFARVRRGETKAGDAVGGARLTIEI